MTRDSNRYVKNIALITALLIFGVLIASASQDDGQFPVSARHNLWLEEEVVYIISDFEKATFIECKTDEERNRFIAAFWISRDPTPGTKENEFLEEHYQRIEQANYKYGRDSSLPGWRTDRGRHYILLGEPQFQVNMYGSMYIQPTELWHYAGRNLYGLPPSFYVMFYRRNGIGTMRLWLPTSDGLDPLLIPMAFWDNMTGLEERADFLQRNVDPEFADAIFSLIPSEGGLVNERFAPNPLSSEMMLASIDNLRNDPDSSAWVYDYISRESKVDVEFSFTDSGEYSTLFTWLQNSEGKFELHYAIAMLPESLTIAQYKDKTYGSVSVDGYLSQTEGATISRIQERSEFTIPKDEVKRVQNSAFELHGVEPIIPGDFSIVLNWRNNITRRAARLSGEISVPDFAVEPSITFTSPILINSISAVEPGASVAFVKPFQVGQFLLEPNVFAEIVYGKPINIFSQIIVPAKAARPVAGLDINFIVSMEDEVKLKQTSSLSSLVSREVLDISQGLPLSQLSDDLESGQYQLHLELVSGDEIIASSDKTTFSIVQTSKPQSWVIRKSKPPYISGIHDDMRANQWNKLGRIDKTIELLEEVVEKKPEILSSRISLMRFLAYEKKYEELIATGESALIIHPLNTDLLVMQATGYLGIGELSNAKRMLERALLQEPDNYSVLYLLSHLLFQYEEYERALEMTNKSLSLSADQPQLLELKEKLEAEIGK